MNDDQRYNIGYANGYRILTWFIYELMQSIQNNQPRPDFNHAIDSVLSHDNEQNKFYRAGVMAALQDMTDFINHTRP